MFRKIERVEKNRTNNKLIVTYTTFKVNLLFIIYIVYTHTVPYHNILWI